jgi:citrate synthase
MTRELVGATEAAARLGVKRETLYAYVSRGLLRRQPSADGRSSRFDTTDLDRLARQRGSRRGQPPRSGAPEIVVASAVTTIVDGQVRYRGRDLEELVGSQPFESVAELLWSGRLPPRAPIWSAPPAVRRVVASVVAHLPKTASPADRMRVAVAAAAAADPLRVDVRAEAVLVTAPGVLVALVDALGQSGQSCSATPVAERAASVAERAALALGAEPRWFEVVDAALVLLADHELASSTLAARVAASTRADPYQVVLAGLAVLSGPLHGSASAHVQRLLTDASAPEGPEVAIATWLRQADRVPGFGHTLYPAGDPRAQLLLPIVRSAAGEGHPGTAAVDGVLAAMARRSPTPPNIDFALGTLTFLAGLLPAVGEALFALSRASGWLAHAMEEYRETPLRFRVRAESLEDLVPVLAPGAGQAAELSDV